VSIGSTGLAYANDESAITGTVTVPAGVSVEGLHIWYGTCTDPLATAWGYDKDVALDASGSFSIPVTPGASCYNLLVSTGEIFTSPWYGYQNLPVRVGGGVEPADRVIVTPPFEPLALAVDYAPMDVIIPDYRESEGTLWFSTWIGFSNNLTQVVRQGTEGRARFWGIQGASYFVSYTNSSDRWSYGTGVYYGQWRGGAAVDAIDWDTQEPDPSLPALEPCVLVIGQPCVMRLQEGISFSARVLTDGEPASDVSIGLLRVGQKGGLSIVNRQHNPKLLPDETVRFTGLVPGQRYGLIAVGKKHAPVGLNGPTSVSWWELEYTDVVDNLGEVFTDANSFVVSNPGGSRDWGTIPLAPGRAGRVRLAAADGSTINSVTVTGRRIGGGAAFSKRADSAIVGEVAQAEALAVPGVYCVYGTGSWGPAAPAVPNGPSGSSWATSTSLVVVEEGGIAQGPTSWAPLNTTSVAWPATVTVTGTPKAGVSLTAVGKGANNPWVSIQNAALDLTYGWTDGTRILGNGATYTPSSADVGKQLYAVVLASGRIYGEDGHLLSVLRPTCAWAATSGTVQPGEPSDPADTGNKPNPNPSGDNPIQDPGPATPGSTGPGSAYQPPSAAGVDAAELSAVSAAAAMAPGGATVSGSTAKAAVGKTLKAAPIPAAWAAAYRWYRDGKPIAGATGAAYKLSPKDAGSTVSLITTMTPPGGETRAVESANVTIAKVRPKVTISKVKGKPGKVKITVKVPGIAKPTGKIAVKFGKVGKTVALTPKSEGAVTVTVPAKAGKSALKVTATFKGNKQVEKGTSKTLKLPPR
jgi:hypothetical protein